MRTDGQRPFRESSSLREEGAGRLLTDPASEWRGEEGGEGSGEESNREEGPMAGEGDGAERRQQSTRLAVGGGVAAGAPAQPPPRGACSALSIHLRS